MFYGAKSVIYLVVAPLAVPFLMCPPSSTKQGHSAMEKSGESNSNSPNQLGHQWDDLTKMKWEDRQQPQDLDSLNFQRGNRGIDRLKIGKEEIKKIKYYDFIIINDTPDNMLTQFNNIIKVVQQNSIISQRDFIDGFYNEDTNKVLKLSKGRV